MVLKRWEQDNHPYQFNLKTDNTPKIVLHRGAAFSVMVFAFGGLVFLILLPLIMSWGGWRQLESGFIAYVCGLLFFLLLSLYGVMRYRQPRTLMANEQGINYVRGKSKAKEIRWEYVKEVRRGIIMDSFYKECFILIIQSKRRRHRIRIESSIFRIHEGSLEEMADIITEMAHSRGIPVVPLKKRDRLLANR